MWRISLLLQQRAGTSSAFATNRKTPVHLFLVVEPEKLLKRFDQVQKMVKALHPLTHHAPAEVKMLSLFIFLAVK